MIKRQIKTDPNADPNETSPFDWSCCCICEKGADLRFTDDGIEVLAKQFVAYRKMIFCLSMKIITNFVVEKDGVSCPDFVTVMKYNIVKYHYIC